MDCPARFLLERRPEGFVSLSLMTSFGCHLETKTAGRWQAPPTVRRATPRATGPRGRSVFLAWEHRRRAALLSNGNPTARMDLTTSYAPGSSGGARPARI